MKTTEYPVTNVRAVKSLVADAPANFADLAVAADLRYSEEAAEWGTRFVIDFADLPQADQLHPLVKQLTALAGENQHDEFYQIELETK